MHRIIQLLDQKNHFLEKFYSLNETEFLNFSQGQYDNLDDFYKTRENIIGMIRYIDTEVEKESQAGQEMNLKEKQLLKEALAIKEEYVGRILSQDLEILSCIESEKSNIIRELQEIKRAKKIVGSYKSPVFNHKLDEEV